MEFKGVCRVCELLDNDKSKKPVTYCEPCDAWICENCEPDLIRRGKALLKTKLQTVKKVMKQILPIVIILLFLFSCKKEQDEPKPATTPTTEYTYNIELDNYPQGLQIWINSTDSLTYQYQLGTNTYNFKTADQLTISWQSQFTTTNFQLRINGITDYVCNNTHNIAYQKTFE